MRYRSFLLLLNRSFGVRWFTSFDLVPYFEEKKHPLKEVSRDLYRGYKMGNLDRRKSKRDDVRFVWRVSQRGLGHINFLLYKEYPQYFMLNVLKYLVNRRTKQYEEYLREIYDLSIREMFGAQSKFIRVIVDTLRLNPEEGVIKICESLLSQIIPGRNLVVVEK